MTIERDDMRMWQEFHTGDRLSPVHPGDILSEDFMKPLGLTQSKVAADLGVSFRRLHEIVNGKRAITAETALLLARYFDVSPRFWMGLQTDYDLRRAMADMPFESVNVQRLAPVEQSA
jgi:addiction module HigA family antidote